jgi:uncharacterized RDD family membrane protein YckC
VDTNLEQRKQPQLAGFLSRVMAQIIDMILVAMVALAPQVVVGDARNAMIAMLCVQFLIAMLYAPTMHTLLGQTVGKMATKIQVRTNGGAALHWQHAFRRSSVDMVLSVILLIGMISAWLQVPQQEYAGASFLTRLQLRTSFEPPFLRWARWSSHIWLWSEFITMLFNSRRRAIHDFIGGTIVVRKPLSAE